MSWRQKLEISTRSKSTPYIYMVSFCTLLLLLLLLHHNGFRALCTDSAALRCWVFVIWFVWLSACSFEDGFLCLEDRLSSSYYYFFCARFKNDDNCYQHISEALDPDGKVSQAQVLNKLKQLGVEVPRKKRKHSGIISPSGQSHPAEGGNSDERGSASVRKSQ